MFSMSFDGFQTLPIAVYCLIWDNVNFYLQSPCGEKGVPGCYAQKVIAHYPFPISHYPLSIAHSPFPTSHFPLSIAHCLFPFPHCPLLIANCSLPITHFKWPFAHCCLILLWKRFDNLSKENDIALLKLDGGPVKLEVKNAWNLINFTL